MSIRIAGDLCKLARREAMDEAAKIAEGVGDKLMREADKYHDAEEPDYDRYEDLESRASLAYAIAGKIRRKARRPASVTRPKGDHTTLTPRSALS